MAGIYWAVPFGLLAFAVHVVVWRIRRPRNSGAALLCVFATVGAWGAVAFAWRASLDGGDWLGGAQAALLYFAGMAGYINTYPAIEADSPSLVLMHELRAAGERGLTHSEILEKFNEGVVLVPRISGLLNENMAALNGERLSLTAKGRLIASIFWRFRQLTGRPIGG